MNGKRASASKTGIPPFLSQLGTFTGLARWGKQAAVKAALGKSQSQVSRDLALLERRLGGVRLLDRGTRRPTDVGQALLDYALRTLEGWERLTRGVSDEVPGGERAVLAVDEDALEGGLLPVLSRLQQRWPSLHLHVHVRPAERTSEELRTGEADVGVLAMAAEPTGLNCRPLFRADLAAVIPVTSPQSRKSRLQVASIRDDVLLVPERGTPIGAALDGLLRLAARKGLEVCELGGGRSAAVAAAVADLGIAIVPSFTSAGDPLLLGPPDRVVVRPLCGARPVVYCVAVRRGLASGGTPDLLLRGLLRSFRPSGPHRSSISPRTL